MKTEKYFEEKIDGLYKKWSSYEKESKEIHNDLTGWGGISKNVLSLLHETKTLRKEYINRFGEPNLLQKTAITLDELMYKSVVLRPIRGVILKRDNKVYTIVSLDYLEGFITGLYKKCLLNYKLKDITNFGNKIEEKSSEDKKLKSIDLTELLKDYHGKDLHLAVTKDYSKVVGTGKTIEEAVKEAEKAGYKDVIITRPPDGTIGGKV